MKFIPNKGILIISVSLLMLFPFVLRGQTENRISIVAMVREDSILLRWAPSSVPVFQAGAKYGYIIKRFTIARNGAFIDDGLSKGINLTDYPVKPASEDHFIKLGTLRDEAAVVQEALYGEAAKQSGGNDFGSFLKNYEENEVRLGFALFMCDMYPEIAKAAGLQFTDHNIIPGERYAYRVSPALLPEGLEADEGVVIADAGKPTVLPAVIDVTGLFGDRIARLKWPVLHLKGIYSAYMPERSFDGRTFMPVSDLPLVNLSEDENQDYFIFTDSISDNETKVWYRIVGISPFGEMGPPSEIIAGKGIPDFSAYAVIDTAWLENANRIVINWRVTENPDSPVKEVNILRSGNNNGPFEKLNKKALSPRSNSFTDNNPGQSNYYQVMLMGNADLRSYSFPYFIQTEDNDPPSPPEALSGSVDSLGLVTIIWKRNTEPDLLGYKVFKGNSPREEFVALDQGIIPENISHDMVNLNTLTGKIFYQVIAIDKNYNSSEYSKILELTRPDTLAPSPALINGIRYHDGTVTINQEASPSNDISHYVLIRKSENDSIRKEIIRWNNELPSEYNDNPDAEGYVEYILETCDKSGNKSENVRKIFVKAASNNIMKLIAEQGSDGKTITIRWKIPDRFNSVKTKIYRGENSGPVTLYRTLTNPDELFSDNDVQIGSDYTYRVVIFDSSNGTISSQNLNFKPERR